MRLWINSKTIRSAATILGVAILASWLIGHGNGTAAEPHDSPYDLSFIDMMIAHHSDGIDMARLAESKAVLPQLKQFATKAASDQEKNRAALQELRDRFYASTRKADKIRMSDMTMTIAEMRRTSEADMNKLKEAATTGFDSIFLDIFSKHHQMAIQMSNDALKNAEHKELKDLARKTTAKQQKDIAEMDRMKRVASRTKQ